MPFFLTTSTVHILLVTHYFPPESNAPANRSSEHARAWLAQGHEVTIVTAAPSHPRGIVYPGYSNVFSDRTEDGIRVIRLPTLLGANRGIVVRSLSFLGFFAAVWRHKSRIPKADAVISTSPQFFCGLAGRILKRESVPWILEVRDLWPESIVAVGAMKRNIAVRILEALEAGAYRNADLVVTTTQSHRDHVLAKAPHTPVEVIPNGVTPNLLAASSSDRDAIRNELGLGDKFVVSYYGTHGMAHRLETIVDAATELQDRDDIRFLLAGDGAMRESIEELVADRRLANVLILGQQPRSRMARLWAACDVALVLLRKSPTFEDVLPSKLIEAMSLGKPVILGVEGEARSLLEAAGAGIAIEPEDSVALASATARLAGEPELVERMSQAGSRFARSHFDRAVLAGRMAAAIEAVRQ